MVFLNKWRVILVHNFMLKTNMTILSGHVTKITFFRFFRQPVICSKRPKRPLKKNAISATWLVTWPFKMVIFVFSIKLWTKITHHLFKKTIIRKNLKNAILVTWPFLMIIFVLSFKNSTIVPNFGHFRAFLLNFRCWPVFTGVKIGQFGGLTKRDPYHATQ